MELQILDCDYIVLNNKPIIRIFGKTINGEAVCVFYDKFLPYFYLYTDQDKIDDIKFELEKNEELKIEVVDRYLPIGYLAKPVKVFKIIGKDPAKTPEIREYVKKFGTPYEADILFKYRFMTDFDLKGMGWIDVKGSFRGTNTVKCKALDAETIKPIEIMENAPLKYVSIDIECLTDGKSLPNPEKDQIIMISISFYPEYKGKKSLVLVARSCNLEDTLSFNDEKELLEKFKTIIDDYDPDIITGYNCENFDIPFILQRLRAFKFSGDIGRSEKIAFTKKLTYSQRTTICGRVILDPYFIIRYLSVYDQPHKFKRYDLDTVAKELLGLRKDEMDGMREVISLWNGSKDNLKRLIAYCRKDADLALELLTSQKLIDINKFIEMSKLSGLLLQDLMSGQTTRHENALLREFYKRKYLMPCKPGREAMQKRSTRELKGALVLEPETGLHKDGCTLVLDFTALYPSLICAHNICPTTLIDKPDNLKTETSPSGSSFVTKDVREGVFPYVAKYLLDTRAEIKKKMKNEQTPSIRKILDAKQYALKGMAVSLYGYTAFIGGRLFTPQVAAAITSWGRQNIEFTTDLIEKNFSVKVVYGDSVTADRFITLLDEDGLIKIVNIEGFFNENKHEMVSFLDKEMVPVFGYKALTIDPVSHTVCWMPINKVIRHKTNKKIYRINQKYGETIVTEDHSLITLSNNGELVETKPLDLGQKNMIRIEGIPRGNEIKVIDLFKLLSPYEIRMRYKGHEKVAMVKTDGGNWLSFGWENREKPILLKRFIAVDTPEFAALCRLIGAYVAEGSSSTPETTKSRIGASISSGDIKFLKQLQSDYFLLFKNSKASIVKSTKNKRKLKYKIQSGEVHTIEYKDRTHKLQMMNQVSAVFFKMLCGQKSTGKKMPDFVFNIPENYQRLILEYMVKGDGSHKFMNMRLGYSKDYKKKNFRYETRSLALMSGLSLLLSILGQRYTIRFRSQKKIYILTTTTEHNKKLITKIKQEVYDGYVYDLEVEGSHMFVDSCGQILLHNTDSIFVKTKTPEPDAAYDLGVEISKFVTQRLVGLELKLDKIFKTFLIETKKRYAGWSFEKDGAKWVEKIEMKGIETVRRDWCSLTSETMLEVLNIVLKEGDVKKASKHVRNIINELAKGKTPIEKLTIVKGITKPLGDYDGIQPHVELAKKIIKRDFTRGPLVGERLEYVIIKGNQLLSKRAEDPDFVKQKGLEIDSEYYVYNQLLPPLERIFEVCGISPSELLEGVKQKNLFDVLNGQKKQPSPEEAVLKTFEAVVCKNCDWSFRRPTLTGNCPKCSGPLYFASTGSIGKTVDLT